MSETRHIRRGTVMCKKCHNIYYRFPVDMIALFVCGVKVRRENQTEPCGGQLMPIRRTKD